MRSEPAKERKRFSLTIKVTAVIIATFQEGGPWPACFEYRVSHCRNRTMQHLLRSGFSIALLVTCCAIPISSAGAALLEAPFDDDYTLSTLGSITDLPTPYGGLTLLAADNNTLLIGGGAN